MGVNEPLPARTLDVEGEARISDLTTDTPTRLVGADADGDLGDAGSGAANRLPLWSGVGTMSFADSIYVSSVGPDRISIGQPALLSPRLYVEGRGTTSSTIGLLVSPQNSLATSASLVVLDNGFIGSGLINPSRDLQIQRSSATSVRASFANTNSSAGFAAFQLQTGGASAGDPHLFVGISGSATAGFAVGLDNSDSDKFKISRSPGDVNQITDANSALIIDENKDVGIRKNDPTSALHVIGEGATSATSSFRTGTSLDSAIIFARNDRHVGINTTTPDVSFDAGDNTDAIKLPSGTTAQEPAVNNTLRFNSDRESLDARENGVVFRLTSSKTPSIAAGAAAGTGPTIAVAGNDLSMKVTLTTGTTATTGALFTVTYASSMDAGVTNYPVFSCADVDCTGLNLYVSAESNTAFTISTQNAPTDAVQYIINIHIGQ